jgi:metal-responsive CopG/Arc/MetJ family transcriptional regulator
MAKVMISLPDDLLADVDREAERRGTTRSGLFRDLADQMLLQRAERRAARAKELLASAQPHGGNAAEQVKANRPKWPKQ